MKIIETKRLILRKFCDDDIKKMSAINQNEKVMEFFPKTYSFEETQDFCNLQNKQIDEKGFGFFAVEEKLTKEFIGFVGLNNVGFQSFFTPAQEIGWRISFEKWNQGFVTEAAKEVLNYGFDKIGLKKIVAFTAEINEKSQRIMQKIGMKKKENGEFFHPKIDANHKLAKHILYEMMAD